MGQPLSASAWLSLFLVFWTGSAWFAALHPRLIRRWLRAEGKPGTAPPLFWIVAGVLYGAAGLLMLALPHFLK